jgi:hypothetical protein
MKFYDQRTQIETYKKAAEHLRSCSTLQYTMHKYAANILHFFLSHFSHYIVCYSFFRLFLVALSIFSLCFECELIFRCFGK